MLRKFMMLTTAAVPVAALIHLFLYDVATVPAPETFRASFFGVAALGTFLAIFR